MNGCRLRGDSIRHREDEESGYTEGVGSNYTELAGEKHSGSAATGTRTADTWALSLAFAKVIVSVSYQL